ncbi:MAG: iron-sulfur cluster repair protein YtfE [Gemmatimonadota bacterium]|nr:MAG: iron-sulfur cluster repair protein YtfE [Gemmatimonadota bacterium]
MEIQSTTPVGRIAAEQPLATRVFSRHGIDFCCGGGKPIQEVCQAKGLDTEQVLEEIRAELTEVDDDQNHWDEADLNDLIDHILTAYHRPLEEELPRLEVMARKVLQVHGGREPEMLPELLSTLLSLKTELEQHMMKEETVLFPMIRQGRGSGAVGPISVMEEEHASAGRALERLRELTNGYQAPADACTTWRALWHGLGALEDDLHQHIHLENNILFPRALTM